MTITESATLSVDQIARQSVRLREADDPESALEMLQAAVERHPDEAILWQCLGLVHRALQDSTAAIGALERAAQLAPDDGKIAHALAHVSFEAGLSALELFDRARTMRPDDRSILIGRAAAQAAAGLYEDAIRDTEAELKSEPHWLEGHQLLADLKWACGYGQAACDSYRDALAQHPQSKKLWLGMLGVLVRVEQFGWAREALDEAKQACGVSEDFRPLEAICASEVGDYAAADRIFSTLFSQQHYLQNPDFLARGARHLLRTGRFTAAATLLESGVSLPEANKLWPYLATTWRLLDDHRWNWLEGDERLIRRTQIYREDELPELYQCLRRLHEAAQEWPGQSVRMGSQTDGQLFARTEAPIRDLRRRIEAAVRAHIAALGPIDPGHPTLALRPRNVRFNGSWSVRLTESGHHSNHIHPQGWLSSALCVAMPAVEDCGEAPAGHLQFGVPPSELGLDLAPFKRVAPRPGWLTLFPSTMWHGTAPIKDGERMAVAFDVKA